MRNLILTLIIWIICFTAITAGVSLTYDWVRRMGKDIYIHFNDVSGLIPMQSKILYHGVQIGNITEINIDLETNTPVIKARIMQQALRLLGPDAKFWLVRPEFGLGSISNLNTLMSGVYVALEPAPGKFTQSFTGLDVGPKDEEESGDIKLTLKTLSAAGINLGSAVLYRDLPIGSVTEMGLYTDKRYVLVHVVIHKQYADVIRKNSYFSNISGFHANLHLFGSSQITLDSLQTLFKGGVMVTTPNFKQAPVKNGDMFSMLTPDQVLELQNQ